MVDDNKRHLRKWSSRHDVLQEQGQRFDGRDEGNTTVAEWEGWREDMD